MPVLICPSCAVANSDSASSCHCCGRTFVPQRAPQSGTVVDTHGYIAPEQQYHATSARRALASAGILSLIRAVVMPWLIAHSPPRSFGTLDAESVRTNALGMAATFLICSLWAVSDPLIPSLLCLSLYVWLAIPDLLHPIGLLASGIISKTVMITVILRAVIAGILYRLLKRGPQ